MKEIIDKNPFILIMISQGGLFHVLESTVSCLQLINTSVFSLCFAVSLCVAFGRRTKAFQTSAALSSQPEVSLCLPSLPRDCRTHIVHETGFPFHLVIFFLTPPQGNYFI